MLVIFFKETKLVWLSENKYVVLMCFLMIIYNSFKKMIIYIFFQWSLIACFNHVRNLMKKVDFFFLNINPIV